MPFWNLSIPSNEGNLEVPGYTLVRADNLNNTKRSGVSIYYLNSLPLIFTRYSIFKWMNKFWNKKLVEKCATFFVYIDHLVKLETSFRHCW